MKKKNKTFINVGAKNVGAKKRWSKKFFLIKCIDGSPCTIARKSGNPLGRNQSLSNH